MTRHLGARSPERRNRREQRTQDAMSAFRSRITTFRGGVASPPLRRRESLARAPIPEGKTDPTVVGRESLYRRALAVADVLAAALAIVLAVFVVGDGRLTPAVLLLALPLAVLVAKISGLYDRDEDLLVKSTLDEAPALFQVATLYTLLITVGWELTVDGGMGAAQVLGLWTFLFASMVVLRFATRRLVIRAAAPERCLLVGDAASEARLRRKLAACRSSNAVIVGRVPLDRKSDSSKDGDVVGSFETLGLVLAEHDVHRVILAPTTSPNEDILDAIRLVKSLGVRVSLLPRLFEVVGSSVRFDNVDGMLLLGVPKYGLSKSSRLLKRALDLCGSAVGLLAAGPALLAMAAAVKLESPGPVFFKQTRIGRDGREFQMLKLRSMVHDAEDRKHDLVALNEAKPGLFKIATDPRITRVGAFMRRLSLDELPQLVNVLRGEMSLVGPRPLVPEDDQHVEGWDRRRLLVPPGMTGTWQVLGSSRVPMTEMVKLDYLYAANWSLWSDVKILLRTVPHVVGRRGL
ncbi:hypothetical protein BH20GEM1_BH20GEM1_11510 [soil metagenome]